MLMLILLVLYCLAVLSKHHTDLRRCQ